MVSLLEKDLCLIMVVLILNSTTELEEHPIKPLELEAFANASLLQVLKLRHIWLENDISGEDWLTLAGRIGSRLSNLRHVTLADLIDGL